MAHYTILHTCGHESTAQLFGPHKDREYKLARMEKEVCPDCKLVEKIKDSDLIGTPKQIAWAIDIKAQALETIRRYITPRMPLINEADKYKGNPQYDVAVTNLQQFMAIEQMMQTIKDAKWWIDNRLVVAKPLFATTEEVNEYKKLFVK